MNKHLAKPEHEVLYQDLVALIGKHKHLSSAELLAVASNMLGKLVAMQDQRVLTPQKALEIVSINLEAGNRQVIESLANTGGNKH